MKIQCDVCERAEATVLCCADEAALCWDCDNKVHAANKLAGKHQRVHLFNPPAQIPKCDICQEKAGYFFCLEDRALLCRQCDVTIHSERHHVSSHQRFLVTGIKVGLEQHTNPVTSPVSNVSSVEPLCEKMLRQDRTPSSGDQMAGIRPHWPLDEILNSSAFDHSYGFSPLGSSRVGSQ